MTHPIPVLGIAGNFTGHLEQAGEANDFTEVKAAAGKPKGIFPIFLPVPGHRLSNWPCSPDTLQLPDLETRVQPEPELALKLKLTWDEGRIRAIRPTAFAAFDDTSLRKAAPKISFKKNWGPNSKGLSKTWIPVDRFDATGILGHIRLACFLERDGVWAAYGEDSPVRDYSTMWTELLDWSLDKLRHQEDHGPLESIRSLLTECGEPGEVILSIGATRYTELGESTTVRPGDRVWIGAYDGRHNRPEFIRDGLSQGTSPEGASTILRTVVPPSS